MRGVRIPLAGLDRRYRSLDERIVLRFPEVARLLAAAWAQLPLHSRLRRAMLVRRLRQGYAAQNRRDFELLLTGFDPDIEFHPGQVFPDVGALFRGHDGYRGIWRQLLKSFEDLRLDPQEVLDMGDRILVTIDLSGHGVGSGVSIGQRVFQLFTLRKGLVVRQADFLLLTEALAAAELEAKVS